MSSAPIRVMYGETSLEQRGSAVLVTFADGTTRTVINTRVSEGMSDKEKRKIVIAAGRP